MEHSKDDTQDDKDECSEWTGRWESKVSFVSEVRIKNRCKDSTDSECLELEQSGDTQGPLQHTSNPTAGFPSPSDLLEDVPSHFSLHGNSGN